MLIQANRFTKGIGYTRCLRDYHPEKLSFQVMKLSYFFHMIGGLKDMIEFIHGWIMCLTDKT